MFIHGYREGGVVHEARGTGVRNGGRAVIREGVELVHHIGTGELHWMTGGRGKGREERERREGEEVERGGKGKGGRGRGGRGGKGEEGGGGLVLVLLVPHIGTSGDKGMRCK